ncbi:Neutral protease [BD1-7 clade bacterium]|uniref:Neutral protease n=1 Tax=BD1-7 clade bacterium TaxID=2029982 RepID=A0A5S9PH85_9GAMM|nr:Neutral protease [BD1-7 clade bacterium]
MKLYLAVLASALLCACGGSDSPKSSSGTEPGTGPGEEPGDPSLPQNPLVQVRFIDDDSRPGYVSGALTAKQQVTLEDTVSEPEFYVVDLYDGQGNLIEADWYQSSSANADQITVAGAVPEEPSYAMRIHAGNAQGRSQNSVTLRFHDFKGNSLMTGPGGNVDRPWAYGEQRPKIAVYRDVSTGVCAFDNGFAYVVDMLEETDTRRDGNNGQSNVADDTMFPAFQFDCGVNPHNTDRPTLFDSSMEQSPDNIWSYSVQNDAMYYGTIVYRSLHAALGEPPLDEKLRIRVHYNEGFIPSIFWDGAYANFTEGHAGAYHSSVTLDIIGHEIGHGVLSRFVPAWASFDGSLPFEVKTAHEAFSDITGFVAKYKHSGQMQWVHAEEAELFERDLSKIVTEEGAVVSYLDYADAGQNFYLGVGLLTYPFYQLVQSRGVDSAYRLFTDAAKNCWSGAQTLESIAQCIKTTADAKGDDTADIVDAFKTVKIQAFDQGVLSHFNVEPFKMRVVFSDNSRSTGQVTGWQWDFGDGNTSTERSPEHTYAEAGDYTVTLRVDDNSQDTDTFSRKLDITDQYCAPQTSSLVKAQIDAVEIDGNVLDYSPSQHSYGATIIHVADDSRVSVRIEGDDKGETGSFTWIAWLDVNDNGVYEESELIKQAVVDSPVYAWTTELNVSAIPNGQARYLRLTGRPFNRKACDQFVGQVLDVRVQQAETR